MRQQILAVAMKQMARKGVGATSLRAIADEVGIKKPSILYHFPSKSALHAAVLDELLARWSEVLPRVFRATAQDGVARFELVLGELLRFFGADPDRARLLVREQLDRPEELRGYLHQYVRPWIDVVAGYIDKGKGRGQGIAQDVDAVAYVILVVNMALVSLATADYATAVAGEAARERCVAELVRVARRGLFEGELTVAAERVAPEAVGRPAATR